MAPITTAPKADRAAFLLGPPAYYAHEWFAREQRDLFTRTWHLVGTAEEVAAPGDYLTFAAGTDPLVITRGPRR